MRRQSWRYIGSGAGLGLAMALTWASYAQDQACVPAPPGMTGWWSGNGNGSDLAANNTALVDNTITFGAGEVGQAFNFQGTHNGVKIARATRLDSRAGFTVEAWLNPATTGPDQPIFEWNNGMTFGVHLWTHEQNGELWANLMAIDGTAHIFKSGPGVLTANTFQHVALAYNRTTGIATIYHNGAVVTQAKFEPFRPQTTNYDFYLGYRPAGDGAGQRFIGLMDEVSAYGRALTAAEIQQIYRAGKAGKCLPAGAATAGAVPGAQPARAPSLPPGAAPSGLPRINGAPLGAAPATPVAGTGVAGAAPVPTPVPTPIPPTPTPIPLQPRPVAMGPIAVLDFSVEPGFDPALGHQVADALAAAMQKSGFEIKTRQQVEQSVGRDAAARDLPHPPYNLATLNRLAQAVGAGSVLVGRVLNMESNKSKSASLQIEVRQLQATTGALMNNFSITETLPTKAQPVPENQLVTEVLQRVIASTLRSLKRAQ